jgi:hypothetical protein
MKVWILQGFKSKINSPFTCFIAWLFALEKPVFSLFLIRLIFGNFSCTICADSSTELLSTTIISASKFCVALMQERKHCSKKNLTL